MTYWHISHIFEPLVRNQASIHDRCALQAHLDIGIQDLSNILPFPPGKLCNIINNPRNLQVCFNIKFHGMNPLQKQLKWIAKKNDRA